MPEISDLISQPFEKYPCWELVREYYKREGVTLPDYKDIDYRNPDKITGYHRLTGPIKGCICAFGLYGDAIDHVGIYLGGNRLLHSTTYAGVVIDHFSKYLPRLKGMYFYDSCDHHPQPV